MEGIAKQRPAMLGVERPYISLVSRRFLRRRGSRASHVNKYGSRPGTVRRRKSLRGCFLNSVFCSAGNPGNGGAIGAQRDPYSVLMRRCRRPARTEFRGRKYWAALSVVFAENAAPGGDFTLSGWSSCGPG